MSAMLPLLALEDLRLVAGSKELIANLQLRIGAGEVWGLLGVNGAGKSSLLRTMAGLVPPAAGRLRVRGRLLADYSLRELAQQRAYLPQTTSDAFPARVIEEVLAARYPHLGGWGWHRPVDWALAQQALAMVGLREYAECELDSLSGGERQRVGIAAAWAQETALLLLDEPLAALDLHHQILVLRRLGELAREQRRAVVYSLHDLNLAYRHTTHCLLFCGAGEVRHGLTQAVMQADGLSRAFGHPIHTLETVQGRVFIAADTIAEHP